jgi:hypothetical protein
MTKHSQEKEYVKILFNHYYEINGMPYFLSDTRVEELKGTLKETHDRCAKDDFVFGYYSFLSSGERKDGTHNEKFTSKPTYFVSSFGTIKELEKELLEKKVKAISAQINDSKNQQTWTEQDQQTLESLYPLMDSGYTHIGSLRGHFKKLASKQGNESFKVYDSNNKKVWPIPKR